MITGRDYFDREGKPVLVRSEKCKACGRDSREIHPAGVVVGKWLCSCGQPQGDPTQLEHE